MDSIKIDSISMVSHKLISPATTVKWYSSMLLSGQAGKLNEKQIKYLKEIQNASQKMINLITTFLKNKTQKP